jgi:hypothetical protein
MRVRERRPSGVWGRLWWEVRLSAASVLLELVSRLIPADPIYVPCFKALMILFKELHDAPPV